MNVILNEVKNLSYFMLKRDASLSLSMTVLRLFQHPL